MAEEIVVGTLRVPVEYDFTAIDRQAEQDLRRRAERAGKAMGEEVGRAADDAKGRVEGLTKAALGLAAVVGVRLTRGLRGFAGFARGAFLSVVDVSALGLLKVAHGAELVADRIAESEGAFRHFAPVVRGGATALEKFAKVALTISGVMTGLQITTAATTAALVIAATRAANEFSPSWNRVRTILGDTRGEFGHLRNEVSQLAGELGATGTKATETFYQILSAMPQLVKEPARALDILRVSLEAGATGFTDAAEAADAITAIINAFNLEAEDARRVSDALFAAQDQGVLTFGEVARSIGSVSDLTASLNGRFEDLLGIAATLTPSGTEVSEVFTAVRAAISNVLKPSEDARAAAEELGVDFSATALKAKGLNGFLLELIETTKGDTDALSRFFGSQEALNLVVALARQTDVLREKTDLIAESAGRTAQNVGIMNESWARQKEIAGEQLRTALRQLGFEFEGVGRVGMTAVNGILMAMNDLLNTTLGADDRFAQLQRDIRETIELQRQLPDNWWGNWVRGGGLMGRLGFGGELADPAAAAKEEELKRQELMGLLFPMRPGPAKPTAGDAVGRIEELDRTLKARAAVDLARTGDVKAYEEAVRAADKAVNDLVASETERLRVAGAAESELAKVAELYRILKDEDGKPAPLPGVPAPERVREVVAQFELVQSAAQKAFKPEIIATADHAVQAYNETVARLTEELYRGEITEKQFAEGKVEAANRFNLYILETIDHLRDLGALSPEVHQALTGALKDGGDAADAAAGSLGNLGENATQLARAARGVLSVADAMGELDDQTRQALEGVINLADGLAAVVADPGDIGGWVQLIGGGVGMISSFLSGDEEAKRARYDQIRAMADLQDALERLRTAVLQSMSTREKAEIERTLEPLDEFARKVAAAPWDFGRVRPGDMTPEQVRAMRQLEEATGLEFFDEETGHFDPELFLEAIEAFKQMDLGAFGRDLEGRLDALNFELSVLGDEAGDAQDRLARFIEALRSVEGDDARGARRFAAALEGMSPEEAEAFINDLARRLAAGDQTLFEDGGFFGRGGIFEGLSGDDARRLIEQAQEFIDALGGGVVGGGQNETRLAVNITEAQANQLLTIESSQLYEIRAIRALMEGGAPLAAASTSPADLMPLVDRLGGTPAPGGGAVFSFGDLTVEVIMPAAAAGIPEVARDAGAAAGEAFGDAFAGRLRAAMRASGSTTPPRVKLGGAQ